MDVKWYWNMRQSRTTMENEKKEKQHARLSVLILDKK